MVLERIEDPALSNIPLSTRRDGKYDEICSKLSLVYGGAIEVGQNIMSTHMKAGKIPLGDKFPPVSDIDLFAVGCWTIFHFFMIMTLSNIPLIYFFL